MTFQPQDSMRLWALQMRDGSSKQDDVHSIQGMSLYVVAMPLFKRWPCFIWALP